jgi:hypothetical protein
MPTYQLFADKQLLEQSNLKLIILDPSLTIGPLYSGLLKGRLWPVAVHHIADDSAWWSSAMRREDGKRLLI